MIIAFHTLGCKVNQYETQAMRKTATEAGYDTAEYRVGDATAYDAVVINSCTVTAESDRKLRQLLRRCRREQPTAVLVVTGCMPQAFPAEAEALTEADIVLGNAQRSQLLTHLATFWEHRQRIVSIPSHGKTMEPLFIDEFSEHTRAFVKIQDGCNRFCSYCIIPYARGRVRSRSLDELRCELQALATRGYREAVLVGINLSAYGQDTGLSLADAVETAARVDGWERIRLGSLEPDFMTEDMITRMAAQPKLCPQFHIALQSGCDKTLKAMNRHYTTHEFATLCNTLRARFPGCALTTDVMVGFPGETDEDFQQSLAFVKQIGFSRVHVFAYSRRKGTVADRLPHQITSAVKDDRSHQMIEATLSAAAAYAETYVGRTVSVLLETPHEDGTADGYTDTYVSVRVRTEANSGEMISVAVTAVDGDTLLGHQV